MTVMKTEKPFHCFLAKNKLNSSNLDFQVGWQIQVGFCHKNENPSRQKTEIEVANLETWNFDLFFRQFFETWTPPYILQTS